MEIFVDALKDTAPMLPLLLGIYIAIELLEYKYGGFIRKAAAKTGWFGPLLGAAVGLFPQCGFSVIATALYTQRLLTVGSLLAVYISTSDEAIPVILAQPGKISLLLPILIVKLIIALIAGYAIDLVFHRRNLKTLAHIEAYAIGRDDKSHHHERALDPKACCGHDFGRDSKGIDYKELFFHPVKHTAKIFIFLFVISAILNYFFSFSGAAVNSLLLSGNFFQPLLAAAVGLIPNCAASVAIAELYLKGILSFGSVIAGLSASGGLGLVLLFKEEKNKKRAFAILGLLFGVSAFSGLIVQLLF